MKMRNVRSNLMLSLILASAIGLPSAVLAQADEARVKKDLTAVLALQGKPCGEITRLENQGENDYLVTCKDGHRYRIFIDANDRVVVQDRT
jgi:hypothetical protein